MENNAELSKHWNKILADEGLSVWAGTTGKDNWVPLTEMSENVSTHPRSFVRLGRDSSRTSLYPLVFSALSEEDQKLCLMSVGLTSVEIAERLGIKPSAVRKRLERLRKWIENQVKSLAIHY